jgi:hypothetical protein
VIHELEPAPLKDKDFRVPDDDGAFTEDDRGLNEDEILFEEFTAPDFNDFESDYEYHDTNINLTIRGYFYGYLNTKRDFVFQILPLIHSLNFSGWY